MEMYVRMYNALKRGAGNNPTLGIILCAEKDETVVKYSVLEENKIAIGKYSLHSVGGVGADKNKQKKL